MLRLSDSSRMDVAWLDGINNENNDSESDDDSHDDNEYHRVAQRVPQRVDSNISNIEHGSANEPAQSANGNDNVIMHPLSEIDINRQFPHMNRIACGAHKMDKLGSKDVLKARDKDEEYCQIHDNVFKVLNKIWDAKNSRLRVSCLFDQSLIYNLSKTKSLRNFFLHFITLFITICFSFFIIQIGHI